MRFWFDTEFIEDGKTIDLMSIGVVCEDGRRYYAELEGCNYVVASDWVWENVIPHLSGIKTNRQQVAADLIDFMGDEPEIWAWYADYDWVALCQLFGTMMDLPNGWPMYCRDVKQLADDKGNPELNSDNPKPHNALEDAIECRARWRVLQEYPTIERSAQ